MKNQLQQEELKNLIKSVFSPGPDDGHLLVIVDLPDEQAEDTPAWKARRRMAIDWVKTLRSVKDEAGLKTVRLAAYRNVHSNNADLPEQAWPAGDLADGLSTGGEPVPFAALFAEARLVIAPTQFSATAPLKLLAKQYGFRAATMPGFSEAMVPALRIDYEEVNRRVHLIKEELDRAAAMDIRFTVDGTDVHDIHFDLRFRTAHASGGRFPDPGVAGNLPSGEAYIVPYEGEGGEPSLSAGVLPVQFGREVVIYRIEANKAVDVLSSGAESDRERELIASEPAYANISELGFGVLADFGMKPVNVVLLDEKLGLHIAFGRSDHFGGAVGVKDFSSPEAVVHIDRIYIPETQNRVRADFVKLTFEGGEEKVLMRDGVYTIF
ncbi:hypothetical protein JXO52_09900 [bacterium]|nr:hypothetical protein [bacterium]